MRTKLLEIYDKLLGYFGPWHWWPAETSFEMMVGASHVSRGIPGTPA